MNFGPSTQAGHADDRFADPEQPNDQAFLLPSERRTLVAVCGALVPALESAAEMPEDLAQIGAEDIGLARLCERALVEISSEQDRRQFRLFLRLLASPLVNGFLSGHWSAFHLMDLSAQTAVLRGWMESRFNTRRAAFQAIKRLALFIFYAWIDERGINPTWEAIGYQAPGTPDPTSGPEPEVLKLNGQDELFAEVLVIGSGAGGSVVAAALAAAGHEVLIVEKGGSETAKETGGLEFEGNAALYERGGGLMTADLGMVVLAGSTLGGGTMVNWSTSLPTPNRVRHEWAQEFGFEGLDGSDYDRATDRVMTNLHIDTDESQANPQNSVLARGGGAIGYEIGTIPRNVDGCVDCTFCGFGCRYGAKQSTRRTYLIRAQENGARILLHAKVNRVVIQGGRAIGAELEVGQAEARRSITVRAKAIVVSAGAIHTPAILMRSGLRHQQLGANLRLHPVTAPVGIFNEPIRSWQGPPQTRVINDMADMDHGYGFRLEVAPAHPGLWASSLQWSSGRSHKQLMAQVDRMANIIVLTRDRGAGRVVLNQQGWPVLHYQLDDYDAGHLMDGAEAAMRVLRAAGARQILSPHAKPLVYSTAGAVEFNDFLAQARTKPIGPNQIGLFSAHQMGSCRLAGDKKLGVVRPDGETWQVRNLFVADASVFPTASGVNPMVTIMACAELLSERIAARIG